MVLEETRGAAVEVVEMVFVRVSRCFLWREHRPWVERDRENMVIISSKLKEGKEVFGGWL